MVYTRVECHVDGPDVYRLRLFELILDAPQWRAAEV
jgi:hypothetical protein